jgi:hypothetical protein
MGIGRGSVSEGLLPHGEALRNAVRWLNEQLGAGKPLSLQLIEEAALRFDLSPLEEDFLRTQFVGQGASVESKP